VDKKEINKTFEKWRAINARQSWRPIASPSINSDTWFGGTPKYSSSDEWPCCEQCNKPMQFLLNLRLDSLPEKYQTKLNTGTLQLFYCGIDDGMCETWAPFSGTHCIRIVTDLVPIQRPKEIEPLPKANIVSWEEFTDFPHPEEHRLLGITYDYDFTNNIVNVHCQSPEISLNDLSIDLDIAETISMAKEGDKLAGWPFWVQGVEYPNCPECSSQMELLMQIDSEYNLKYMFGDTGCAHLTQCQNHPKILAFGWACG